MEEVPVEIAEPPPPEEAEAPAEAMAAELPREAMEEPAPATPPPAPRGPEVTPDQPKPKARGRPKGSTNRNTYQALAQRLDQMDAILAERQEELRQRRERSPPRRSAPSSAEEAAAHFISQIGIQAEERRRQRMEVYRSFLPQ